MSVYNGQRYLRESVESILDQTFADFELIIVNDGSTDASRAILAEYEKRDCRVRVIDQENQGLTRALIRGCEEARGEYIARQDADDRSHPERLARQVELLRGHPEVSLLSCFTHFIGPEGEDLFTVERHDAPPQATARLRAVRVQDLLGVTHHGSALFRRSDYDRAGGYRKEFYFAQDMDLWTRLVDHGMLAFVREVLYSARFEPSAISGRYARHQQELAKIIVQLRAVRERGVSEAPLLARAAAIRPGANGWRPPRLGGGDYFIARVLQARGDPRAIHYLHRALRANPFHLKARVALLRSAWRKR